MCGCVWGGGGNIGVCVGGGVICVYVLGVYYLCVCVGKNRKTILSHFMIFLTFFENTNFPGGGGGGGEGGNKNGCVSF